MEISVDYFKQIVYFILQWAVAYQSSIKNNEFYIIALY